MQRAALFVFLVALHACANAACQSGLAERLHEKLGTQRQLIHELTVCHAWHGHLGRSVVVLPTQGAAPGTLDLDILVVQQPDNGNSEHSTILARQRQTVPSRGSDAMAVSDIEFDTARYRLSALSQSFGLRIYRRSMAAGQPASSETLSLYGLDHGNQLHLLLDEFETRRERGHWGPGCAGHFEKQERQLSVVHSTMADGSKGMADLQVRQTATSSVNELQGDECVESSELPRFTESTLRFDGRQYRAASPN
ncbi:MAG: hypothetical protein JSS56_11255 [Proteobacteria bacterium]|nr:hypothetical protein [Pseudomonadota bacterium]